jgi:hypothetical protein
MKQKIDELANGYVVYTLYLLLFFSFTISMRSCGTNKEVSKLKREVFELNNTIQLLNSNIYTKEEINIRMSIEGYEISKRMLYDQNSIVRTVIRPDDRMNEYDEKIKELREKIK